MSNVLINVFEHLQMLRKNTFFCWSLVVFHLYQGILILTYEGSIFRYLCTCVPAIVKKYRTTNDNIILEIYFF